MKKIFVKSVVISLLASLFLLNVTGCKNDVPVTSDPIEDPVKDLNLADQLPMLSYLTDDSDNPDGNTPIVIIKDSSDPDGNTIVMVVALFGLEKIAVTKNGSILSVESIEPTVIPSTTIKASVSGTYNTNTKEFRLTLTLIYTEEGNREKQDTYVTKKIVNNPISALVGTTFTGSSNTLTVNSETSVTLNGKNYILQLEGVDNYYLKVATNEPTTTSTPRIYIKEPYTINYFEAYENLFSPVVLECPIYPIDNFINVGLTGKKGTTTYAYIFTPKNSLTPTKGTFKAGIGTQTREGNYIIERTGPNKYTCSLSEPGSLKKETIIMETTGENTIVIGDINFTVHALPSTK